MPLSYDDEAYDPASVVDIKPKMEDPSKGLIQFRIGDQIRHIIELSDLSPKQKKRCSIGLEIIVAKLFSVWSLRDSYAKLEDELVNKAVNNPAKVGTSIELTGWQNLYRDFDLWSVQVKSVLDHIVFYLRFGVGRQIFTFHKKGAVIINELENNLPADSPAIVKKTAARIVALIKENTPWLTNTIDVRDDFNHYTSGRFHPASVVLRN